MPGLKRTGLIYKMRRLGISRNGKEVGGVEQDEKIVSIDVSEKKCEGNWRTAATLTFSERHDRLGWSERRNFRLFRFWHQRYLSLVTPAFPAPLSQWALPDLHIFTKAGNTRMKTIITTLTIILLAGAPPGLNAQEILHAAAGTLTNNGHIKQSLIIQKPDQSSEVFEVGKSPSAPVTLDKAF